MIPSLNVHELAMKAERMNGLITEVKQLRPWLILRWNYLGSMHFAFL